MLERKIKTSVYIRYSFEQEFIETLQGYLREGKCQLALGEAQAATCSFRKVLDLDPDNATAKTDVRAHWAQRNSPFFV